MDQEHLRELHVRGELDTVVVAGVDYHGRLFGKRLEAGYMLDPERDGTLASLAVLASTVRLEAVDGLSFGGAETGFGDLLLKPDYSTTRMLPWFERTALVLADICRRDHTELPTAPRAVLKRQLARARQKGLAIYAGSELEFYLFKESPESARQKNYRDLQPIGEPAADYNLLSSSREEWFLQLLRNQLIATGIPVESSKPEFGAGQMEVNLLFAEALEMADRHVIFKHAVKEISQVYGFLATFMAKPFSDQAGSGGHIHISALDAKTGANVFFDSERSGPSDVLRSFLAGIHTLAPDVFLMYAPYVNSYKRLVPNNFAPYLNTIGLDDRTAAFRIVGQGDSLRIENRLPGADVNGYLAMAAMIACGLHGIENGLQLGDEAALLGRTTGAGGGGGGPDPARRRAGAGPDSRLPENPVEAIEMMASSETARQLLGEELVDDLAAFSRAEVRAYFREVTDWERQVYLEQA